MKVYVVCRVRHDEYNFNETEVDINFITSSKLKAQDFVNKNPSYNIIEKLFTPKKYHLGNPHDYY